MHDEASGATRADRGLGNPFGVVLDQALGSLADFLTAAEVGFEFDHLDVRTSGKCGHLVHGGTSETINRLVRVSHQELVRDAEGAVNAPVGGAAVLDLVDEQVGEVGSAGLREFFEQEGKLGQENIEVDNSGVLEVLDVAGANVVAALLTGRYRTKVEMTIARKWKVAFWAWRTASLY